MQERDAILDGTCASRSSRSAELRHISCDDIDETTRHIPDR
jgi:hypothetical protein